MTFAGCLFITFFIVWGGVIGVVISRDVAKLVLIALDKCHRT